MLVRYFLSTFLCLLLCATSAAAASVTGKVALDGVGTAGVRVAAYPVTALSLAGDASFFSAATGADGLFRLDLPPGQYYLLARGGGWFSFYGRNPLAIPAEGVSEINLPLVPSAASLPELPAIPGSGVTGQVLHSGKPVANAVVFAYPDLSAQLKGFGLGMSAPTGADGIFELSLAAGSYYLVARVRQGASLTGPLTAGDLFGYLPQNPVAVAEAPARVVLPLVAVPEKVARHAGTMFGQTRISGAIVDRAGKPLAGMKALLYADESMLNRPLYVSAPTGPDGIFQLSFPSGGTYYLAARSSLGGTPAPGELYGRYQVDSKPGFKIETGALLEGVRIVVEEVW